jgi:hypothetical protein
VDRFLLSLALVEWTGREEALRTQQTMLMKDGLLLLSLNSYFKVFLWLLRISGVMPF